MENYQDYKTIQASSSKDLASTVRTWMKEGWVPLGSVTVAVAKTDGYGNVTENGKDGHIYVQSMVMPAKK